MATFDAEEHGDLSGLMGGENIGGRKAVLKLLRVAANLLEWRR